MLLVDELSMGQGNGGTCFGREQAFESLGGMLVRHGNNAGKLFREPRGEALGAGKQR